MSRPRSVLDVVFWTAVLAIIYMLVRPASQAGQAMIAMANALAGVIATATGAPAATTTATTT
jgi:hypothetical protein